MYNKFEHNYNSFPILYSERLIDTTIIKFSDIVKIGTVVSMHFYVEEGCIQVVFSSFKPVLKLYKGARWNQRISTELIKMIHISYFLNRNFVAWVNIERVSNYKPTMNLTAHHKIMNTAIA